MPLTDVLSRRLLGRAKDAIAMAIMESRHFASLSWSGNIAKARAGDSRSHDTSSDMEFPGVSSAPSRLRKYRGPRWAAYSASLFTIAATYERSCTVNSFHSIHPA